MPKDDVELSVDEAVERVKAHEKKHGREMKAPPGLEKKSDVPTRAELDADPDPVTSNE